MRRLLAILVMAIFAAGCSLGGPPGDATGEEVYVELCARCHGVDLEGGVFPAVGPGSSAAGESDEYLEFTIVNGRGRMPSFPSLSEEQVDSLVAYMREVQAGE